MYWLPFFVLCLGFLLPHINPSYAAKYYVTPHSPDPNCPSGEPCLTLNEYAQRDHFEGNENITLLFLKGEHNLTTKSFEITNKTSIEMAPRHMQDEAVIYISKEMHIWVQNVFVAALNGLNFVSGNNTFSVLYSRS